MLKQTYVFCFCEKMDIETEKNLIPVQYRMIGCGIFYRKKERQKYRQREKKKERQKERKTEKQKERNIDRKTERKKDILIEIKKERKKEAIISSTYPEVSPQVGLEDHFGYRIKYERFDFRSQTYFKEI